MVLLGVKKYGFREKCLLSACVEPYLPKDLIVVGIFREYCGSSYWSIGSAEQPCSAWNEGTRRSNSRAREVGAENTSRKSGYSLIPSRSGPAATIGGKSGGNISSLLASPSLHIIFHLEIEGLSFIGNILLWRDIGEPECGYSL